MNLNDLNFVLGPQVEITVPKKTGEFTTHKDHHKCDHLNHVHLSHHPWSYSVSSYDLPNKLPPPCCSLHHTSSAPLTCKELLEAHQRETQKHKLEKTNHLVDSLVGEVKSLQVDLRRKSIELKMKEIEMAREEAELKKKKKASEENLAGGSGCCHRRRLSVSFKDDCPTSPRVSLSSCSSSCHLHKSESSESLTSTTDSSGT